MIPCGNVTLAVNTGWYYREYGGNGAVKRTEAMMTAAAGAKLIGRRALLRTSGLAVEVEIRDAREVFGRTDVLVIPSAGAGSAWVSLDSVELGGEG